MIWILFVIVYLAAGALLVVGYFVGNIAADYGHTKAAGLGVALMVLGIALWFGAVWMIPADNGG